MTKDVALHAYVGVSFFFHGAICWLDWTFYIYVLLGLLKHARNAFLTYCHGTYNNAKLFFFQFQIQGQTNEICIQCQISCFAIYEEIKFGKI